MKIPVSETRYISTEEFRLLPKDEQGFSILPNGNRLKLGSNVQLGERVMLGDAVTIGDDVAIHDDCVIEPGCIIENDCTLHPCVHLDPEVHVKAKSTIGAYARVGRKSAIGPEAEIGVGVVIGIQTEVQDKSHIADSSILGDEVYVASDVLVEIGCALRSFVSVKHGARIYPFTGIPESTQILENMHVKQPLVIQGTCATIVAFSRDHICVGDNYYTLEQWDANCPEMWYEMDYSREQVAEYTDYFHLVCARMQGYPFTELTI